MSRTTVCRCGERGAVYVYDYRDKPSVGKWMAMMHCGACGWQTSCTSPTSEKYAVSALTGKIRQYKKCPICGEWATGKHCRDCSLFYDKDGHPKRTDVVMRVCEYEPCGREYVAPVTVPNVKAEGAWRTQCCSKVCKQRWNKRQWHRENGEKPARTAFKRTMRTGADRLRLAFEYGYKCVRCGELIDLSLAHPDPMSLSMDHLKPIACFEEGTPVEVVNARENLGPAHLRCNASAGATPVIDLRVREEAHHG